MNNSETNIIIREKAIKYIGISKKTEAEVRNKIKNLKGLNITSSVIDEEIDYLKELGYINDIDYAESYIRQCIKMQQYSIYEIKQKLLQKGIKISIIEEKLDTVEQSDYEKMLQEKLMNGKLKSYDQYKAKDYLYRRGFRV